MKAISQQLVGNPLKKDEEQAVRDFLEALRSARLKEQEQDEKEVRTSEYRTQLNATELQDLALNETEAAVFVDYIASDRNDKKTLRNSLEKLTNFYLTRLIEDSDYFSLEDSDEDKDVNNRNKRDLRGVTRKIYGGRKKLNPGSCSDMNRRIGVLSHLEIQKSLRNFSNSELNIRKALNYRSVHLSPHFYIYFELLTHEVFPTNLDVPARTIAVLSLPTITLTQPFGKEEPLTSNIFVWMVSSCFIYLF